MRDNSPELVTQRLTDTLERHSQNARGWLLLNVPSLRYARFERVVHPENPWVVRWVADKRTVFEVWIAFNLRDGSALFLGKSTMIPDDVLREILN